MYVPTREDGDEGTAAPCTLHLVADHFNIVGLRIAGVSYGRSLACNVS